MEEVEVCSASTYERNLFVLTQKKPSTKVENEGDETSSNEAGEEDCCHDFTPIVQLKEVEPVRTDIEEDIVWEK